MGINPADARHRAPFAAPCPPVPWGRHSGDGSSQAPVVSPPPAVFHHKAGMKQNISKDLQGPIKIFSQAVRETVPRSLPKELSTEEAMNSSSASRAAGATLWCRHRAAGSRSRPPVRSCLPDHKPSRYGSGQRVVTIGSSWILQQIHRIPFCTNTRSALGMLKFKEGKVMLRGLANSAA